MSGGRGFLLANTRWTFRLTRFGTISRDGGVLLAAVRTRQLRFGVWILECCAPSLIIQTQLERLPSAPMGRPLLALARTRQLRFGD